MKHRAPEGSPPAKLSEVNSQDHRSPFTMPRDYPLIPEAAHFYLVKSKLGISWLIADNRAQSGENLGSDLWVHCRPRGRLEPKV